MHQTLFVIPSWLFDGWLLVGWLAIATALLGFTWFKGPDGRKETLSLFPFLLVVAAVVHFVLPRLQVMGLNPADPSGPEIPSGLAIQGYGFFLLFGIVFGIGLTVIRCHQVGFNVDRLLTLSFWMIVSGILGARIFYIVQKRDQFAAESVGQFVSQLLDMTSGGLVVYGSLIGGFLGAVIYLWRARLSHARVADLIAPGMALGLCIGRIGCLMNGCCYGGVCEQPLPAISFPAGSSPYFEQLMSGELLGMKSIENSSSNDNRSETYPIVVAAVEQESIASDIGIAPGDHIQINVPSPKLLRAVKKDALDVEADTYVGISGVPGSTRISAEQLPDRSLKTHPTQIYSSINAGLLCLVLWFYYPFRRVDGEVFALMLILYPLARFLLEMIRVDESGIWGTPFTISQLLSIVLLIVGVFLFAYLRLYGREAVTAKPTTA